MDPMTPPGPCLDADRWHRIHRLALSLAAGGTLYPDAVDIAHGRIAIEDSRRECGKGKPSPSLRVDVIPIPQETAA